MEGLPVGAGAQFLLRAHANTTVEYNYARYNTYDLRGVEGRFDRRRILAGVGVRF